MSGWDGDKNDFLNRGGPKPGAKQFRVNPEHCCEACTFGGRGVHSPWCERSSSSAERPELERPEPAAAGVSWVKA